MNILAISVLLIAVLSLLIYILIYMPIQERKKITNKIANSAEFHRVMARIRRETNIERILVLRSHNGNGLPSPGVKIKVTAIDESYQAPFRSVVEKYRNLAIDGEYLIMLDQIRVAGHVAFFTHDLPDNSLLKQIYISEGVYWSYVFFLSWDNRSWYYASLSTSKQESPFQAGQGLALQLGANDMKTVFKKIYDTPFRLFRRKMYV